MLPDATDRIELSRHLTIQVRTKTAGKFHTWIGYRPLAALYGTYPIQVRTKMAKKFLTWRKRHSV